jgi:hypothetical protein
LTVQDNGCLLNLHTVTFDITNDDLDALPTPVYIKTVIVTIGNTALCGDWDFVVSNVIGKTCRKLTVTASTSSTGLVASFTPDSIDCRQKKWVIPVAVGVSVLLAVLIVISLCIYWIPEIMDRCRWINDLRGWLEGWREGGREEWSYHVFFCIDLTSLHPRLAQMN